MNGAALILAGGKSKRMGMDKALIQFRKKPLLLHAVKTVLTLVNEVKVVIAKNDAPQKYSAILPPEVQIITDEIEGKGPLAGILVGMQNIRSEYVAVLPCDSPFIKTEVLACLFCRAQEADAAIPRWPDGRVEPLHSVYRVSSSVSAAKSSLQEEELLVIDMVKRLGKVIYLDVDELRKFDRELITFFNINNREDLLKAKMLEPILQDSTCTKQSF